MKEPNRQKGGAEFAAVCGIVFVAIALPYGLCYNTSEFQRENSGFISCFIDNHHTWINRIEEQPS